MPIGVKIYSQSSPSGYFRVPQASHPLVLQLKSGIPDILSPVAVEGFLIFMPHYREISSKIITTRALVETGRTLQRP